MRHATSHTDLPHTREMLRIKRSVAASFSSVHFNVATVGQAPEEGVGAKRKRDEGLDDMAALEEEQDAAAQQGTRVPGFVSAGVINSEQVKEEAAQKAQGKWHTLCGECGDVAACLTHFAMPVPCTTPNTAAAVNPEDIALDDEEEEEEELVEKAVPASVFGMGGS